MGFKDIKTIRERNTAISVVDLIEALKEHKEKELAINIWILDEEGKNRILVGTPEILGGIDNNMFNFTLVLAEWELEEEEE